MRFDQKLQELKQDSKNNKELVYTNPKGEVFVYENGELTQYTDTRVIDHLTDRLKNLAETPFQDGE